MERRSPTGIDRREAVETTHRQRAPGRSRQKAGSKPSGFAAISSLRCRRTAAAQIPSSETRRKWSAGLRPASRPERAARPRYPKGGHQTLRVRCHQFPRGADAPQRRRSPAAKSAEMERRSPTGIAAREGRETALPPKAGTKPSGFAAISFPAVLTHRSGADPQQRKARKWSAGLRPASRPERAAKPRYPTPTDEADDHGQSCARSQRPAFTGLFRM